MSSGDTPERPESGLAQDAPAPRVLTPAAERALAEAAARRKEVDGRGGKDPVRYNDWEIKGLTADF
jgi:hypothetical protein